MDDDDVERIFSTPSDSIRADGPCPKCDAKLLAIPILDARLEGLLDLTAASEFPVVQEDTQLVFCRSCRWWGAPSRAELAKIVALSARP
jgi:hypothetical protein